MTDGHRLMISILASVLPTVAYVAVIWWLDHYEKEPLWLLAVAFLWGALPAVILSMIVEVITSVPTSGLETRLALLVEGSLIAPLIEEGTKALVLFGIYCLYQREFNGVLDGLVYGTLVGFGFGMTENFSYYLSHLTKIGARGWSILVLMRGLVFGSNHALFSGITGIGLGFAVLAKGRLRRLVISVLGFGLAVFFHMMHNLFTSLSDLSLWMIGVSVVSDWGGLLMLGLILILAWHREKTWLTEQLRGEVTAGLLTEEEYAIICSYRRRVARWWKVLATSGWHEARHLGQLFHLSTELAFQKNRREKRGDEKGLDAGIARLRQAIASLRAEPDHRALLGKG